LDPSWICEESVGNLRMPKLAWCKVLSQKLIINGHGTKGKQLHGKLNVQGKSKLGDIIVMQRKHENSKCQWGH
jgi:hypothetical protein